MKHHRRLVGVSKKKLLEDVENDRKNDKGHNAGGDDYTRRRCSKEFAKRAGDSSDKTHAGVLLL